MYCLATFICESIRKLKYEMYSFSIQTVSFWYVVWPKQRQSRREHPWRKQLENKSHPGKLPMRSCYFTQKLTRALGNLYTTPGVASFPTCPRSKQTNISRMQRSSAIFVYGIFRLSETYSCCQIFCPSFQKNCLQRTSERFNHHITGKKLQFEKYVECTDVFVNRRCCDIPFED